METHGSTRIDEGYITDVMAVDDLEGFTGAGQHKIIDDCGGAIKYQEEPEQLIHALDKDVLPHQLVNEWLIATMRLVQQQLWSWILGCQGCMACIESVIASARVANAFVRGASRVPGTNKPSAPGALTTHSGLASSLLAE